MPQVGSIEVSRRFRALLLVVVLSSATIYATTNGLHPRLAFAGPATHFVVLSNPSATAGVRLTFAVRALDDNDQPDANYRGTVHFSSSDRAAVLPPDYTFTAADAGEHQFSGGVTFNTPGSQTITATDVSTPAITGTSAPINVTSGPTSSTSSSSTSTSSTSTSSTSSTSTSSTSTSTTSTTRPTTSTSSSTSSTSTTSTTSTTRPTTTTSSSTTTRPTSSTSSTTTTTVPPARCNPPRGPISGFLVQLATTLPVRLRPIPPIGPILLIRPILLTLAQLLCGLGF